MGNFDRKIAYNNLPLLPPKADIETLKEFADSINPKSIIPIHTFNKQDLIK